MPHPAMSPNHVAVITGGASGIGLAAALRFAALGMKICIADVGADRLAEAAAKLSSVAKGGDADVMTAAVDVSRFDDVAGLEAAVQKRFGGADILMNNAGIGPDSNSFGPLENWQRILAVNLWGIIHGTQVFDGENALPVFQRSETVAVGADAGIVHKISAPPNRFCTAASRPATSSNRLTSTAAVMTSASPPFATEDSFAAASASRSAPTSAIQTSCRARRSRRQTQCRTRLP